MPDEIRLKNVNFGLYLTLFSSSWLLVSVSYELGFYAVIGLDFYPLLSTSDHFANAVTVLPMTLLALGISALWGRADTQRLNTKHVIKKSKINKYFDNFIFYLFVIYFLSVQAFWIPLLSLVAFVLWFKYGLNILLLNFDSLKDNVLARTICLVVPLGIVAAFYFGSVNAIESLKPTQPDWELCKKNSICKEVKMVSMFSGGTIFYYESEAHFVPQSEIESVSTALAEKEYKNSFDFFLKWLKRVNIISGNEESSVTPN